MNPIFWRETRVRPRSRMAPWWVPAACVPAACILLACTFGAEGVSPISSGAAKAFQLMAAMQTLAWLIVGATATAGTIAAERERGLLESLQLSGMTPAAILRGKLVAALAFACVVTLAALPVWTVTILVGGISMEMAGRTVLLHGTTALLGASVGLAWSAWTRRAAAALRLSLISLGIWGVASLLAAVVARNNGPQGAVWAAWCVAALRLAGATNPLAAAFSLAEIEAQAPLLLMAAPSGALRTFDAVAATSPFVVSLVFQLLTAPLLLALATRGITASFDAPPKRTRLRKRAAAAKPDGPPFYDIPFVARLRFANPVMAREIKGKFRQPRVPRWVVWTQSALGLAVLGFYLLVMWWAQTRPATRAQTWWVIAFTGLGVVMTAAPMMGAANFARERERGTWEGVLLTPLSARAVTTGKIGSALLAIAAFSLPLLPLLALCAGRAGGVSPVQAALTFLFIGATAYAFTAFGSVLSWKAERTAPVAGGMLLFVAVQFMAPFVAVRPGMLWLMAVNPPSTLAVLAGAGRAFGVRDAHGVAPVWWALGATVVLCAVGVACEAAVRRGLRREGHP